MPVDGMTCCLCEWMNQLTIRVENLSLSLYNNIYFSWSRFYNTHMIFSVSRSTPNIPIGNGSSFKALIIKPTNALIKMYVYSQQNISDKRVAEDNTFWAGYTSIHIVHYIYHCVFLLPVFCSCGCWIKSILLLWKAHKQQPNFQPPVVLWEPPVHTPVHIFLCWCRVDGL